MNDASKTGKAVSFVAMGFGQWKREKSPDPSQRNIDEFIADEKIHSCM